MGGRFDGVIHVHFRAVRLIDFINDARRGRNQIEVKLAFQPLLNDLHVQQSQEAAAEAEAQRHGSSPAQRSATRRSAEAFPAHPCRLVVIRAVRRINAAENHRVSPAGSRAAALPAGVRASVMVSPTRVSRTSLMEAADIADVTRPQRVHRFDSRGCTRRLPLRRTSRPCPSCGCVMPALHRAVHDMRTKQMAPLVVVIEGVKDQRLQRGVLVARRARASCLHHRFPALRRCQCPSLAEMQRRFGRVQTDHVLDLRAHLVRPRAGQVNLVDDRHDLQIVVDAPDRRWPASAPRCPASRPPPAARPRRPPSARDTS